MNGYFTQAELEVMLELSGGPAHTLFRAGPPPDDYAVTAAFASLYRRGLLVRAERAFLPSDRAAYFRDMCAAPLAVAVRARDRAALCYVGGATLWVCEHVRAARVRLSRIPYENLEAWLFETGLLEPPMLTAEDARELSLLRDEDGAPGEARLRMEKRRNGGGTLGVYELLDGEAFPCLHIAEGGTETVEPYTREALRTLLARCFGKDGQS